MFLKENHPSHFSRYHVSNITHNEVDFDKNGVEVYENLLGNVKCQMSNSQKMEFNSQESRHNRLSRYNW